MSGPRVTIAVMQRESFGHTKRSLDSLYATAEAPFDLIYFDTGSPRPVQRLIDREARRHGFLVRRYPTVIAPTATYNLAVAAIGTEFVGFVDNDVIFKPGWLRQLLACADETGADIVMRFRLERVVAAIAEHVMLHIAVLVSAIWHVGQRQVRDGGVDFVGLGRMVLAYPELPADVLAGKALDRKRICRTFSDCTTAPRNGLVSGCYPLDPFYKGRPERIQLNAIKQKQL